LGRRIKPLPGKVRIGSRLAKKPMKPSVVVLGFVLGAAFSITFSLFGVSIVYWMLGADYPRLAEEAPNLHVSLAFFAALTGFAALSFYAWIKALSWRWLPLLPLTATLVVIGLYYWPD
jgi:hypothetical protein